ncbi:hypothetical protein KSP39_PZI014160 [Platanthera zijinensis]|uniref:Uncharacterized protein n=1 Tax=Platanthera zijinensis TaxID=2320716 RepID=A0AAP0BBV3_9ASPA
MRRLSYHALMCGRLKSGDDFLLQRSINWWDESYVDPHPDPKRRGKFIKERHFMRASKGSQVKILEPGCGG